MAASGTLFTRATAFTLLRLLLAPVLAWAIAGARPEFAALVFWLAVASDVADGWLARRDGQVTRLGGVIDHAVDAVFVSVGCWALSQQGVLPGALALLIVLAFLQYSLDSRVFAAQRLRPSPLGRWNGIAYYVIVAVPIMRDTLGLGWPGPGLLLALGWLLAASTLLSMLDRFRAFVRGRRVRDSRA
jgi:cardiolipin synthase